LAGGPRDAPAVKHLAKQRILVVRERHVMLDAVNIAIMRQ
jgi:hypothetical protein